MKRFLAFFAALLITSQALAADVLELTNFTLIDGTGAPARAVKRLVARNGVIIVIDDAGDDFPIVANDRVRRIDLGGAFVIPGLIDTHVHVARFPDTRDKAQRLLEGALRGGVTAVRDLTGDARALADIERSVSLRGFIGPTVVYSSLFGGPDVFKGGPTASMSQGRTPGTAPWSRLIEPSTDVRLAVAQAIGTGSRNLKIYGDLDDRLATKIITEARAQGLMTTAHGTVFSARPSTLVAAGGGTLSHVSYLVWEAADVVPRDFGLRTKGDWKNVPANHPKLLALYDAMAKAGTTLDATLFVFRNMPDFAPGGYDGWAADAFTWGAEATKLAHRAGVKVTTGTDWFEPTDEYEHPNTHHELQLLVSSAEFTPMEAIVAATRNGAIALGLEKTHGTLELGKFVDLVVLDANPLENVENTRRIRFVVRHGDIVAPAF